MEEKLMEEIKKLWIKDLLGKIENIEIEKIYNNSNDEMEENNEKIKFSASLFIANISAALSTRMKLGSANDDNLKEVKASMDTAAGYAFKKALLENKVLGYVAASEGKDEYADVVEDPLKDIEELNQDGYGIAVDVIDGTTLAAKGIKGAYTLSACARNLKSFPDMQGYAVAAPKKVLDSFNFFNKPEEEVKVLIKNLSKYLNKPISELKIVTSSYDKGNQHQRLIDVIKEMGAEVVIPDPVIVEPPYIINVASKKEGSYDAIIGVLGLPEMVINTILLSSMNMDCDMKFRIGSNNLVSDRLKEELDNTFNFKDEELEELKNLNLDINKVYGKEDICDIDGDKYFCGTSLTGCDILDMNGIGNNEKETTTESILTGICNNTYKIKVKHSF